MKPRTHQSGVSAVAAIVAVALLALLSTAILRFSFGQHMASALDVQSAKAWQTAKAGTEWGLFQVLQGAGVWRTASACNGASHTLDLSAWSGFRVTVQCAATDYSEGERAAGVPQTMRNIRIVATACNATAPCPNNGAAVTPGYVERVREVIAYCPVDSATGNCL